MEAFTLPFKVQVIEVEPRSEELVEGVERFCHIVELTLRDCLDADMSLGPQLRNRNALVHISTCAGVSTQIRRGLAMQTPALACVSHAYCSPSSARLTRPVHKGPVKAFVAGPKWLCHRSRHAKIHCQAQDRSSSVTDVQKIDTEKGGLPVIKHTMISSLL